MLYIFVTASFIVRAQDDSIDFKKSEQLAPSTEDTTALKEESEKKLHFSLKSISDTLIVKQRNLPLSAVKTMKEDDDFWYANAEIEKKDKKKKNREMYVPATKRNWFQTVLWIIIIGLFASAITWYLASSNIRLFRKKNWEDDITNEELMPENIFAINYQKEIDKATLKGNYRMAVRLRFLKILKNLNEKNIIQYKQDKTNLDYLLQLQPTDYYNNFFKITRNYEYCWYGMFELNAEVYEKITNDFNLFEKQIYS